MKAMAIITVALAVNACDRAPVGSSRATDLPTAPSTQALRLPDSEHGGRPLDAALTGDAEVPGPGDPDGHGTAVITANWGQGEICYELTVSNIDPATAAHIHQAPAGQEGPVVFSLSSPTAGSSRGCLTVDSVAAADPGQFRQLARRADVFSDPSQYYVNVHNAAFPNGAIRGQLSRK